MMLDWTNKNTDLTNAYDDDMPMQQMLLSKTGNVLFSNKTLGYRMVAPVVSWFINPINIH